MSKNKLDSKNSITNDVNSVQNRLIKLTDFEKILLFVNKCGDSIVMITSFIESNDSTTKLDQITCQNALFYLQRRHPFLRAFLTDNFYLEIQPTGNCPPLDLEWSDCNITYDDLITQLEEFNCKLFDFKSRSYLARCKVLSFIHPKNNIKMFAVNLVVSIAITDGINITVLMIELINIINALILNQECKEMTEELEVVESLNQMTDKQRIINWKQKLAIQFSLFHKSLKSLLPKELRPINESGFKLNFLAVDKNLTGAILKKVKEKNVKITSYLTAVLYYSLKDLYDENKLKFPKKYACALPVNMRMRYEPNMDFSHMRNHVCYIEVNLVDDEMNTFENIWKDAENIQKQVVKMTSLGQSNLFAATHCDLMNKLALKLFNNCSSIETICKIINNENHTDFCISNIGPYVWNKNFINEGPFKIKENYFSDSSQSKPNVLPGLLFHISFWNDQIMIQLSSNKSTINAKFVDRLIQLINSNLIKTIQ